MSKPNPQFADNEPGTGPSTPGRPPLAPKSATAPAAGSPHRSGAIPPPPSVRTTTETRRSTPSGSNCSTPAYPAINTTGRINDDTSSPTPDPDRSNSPAGPAFPHDTVAVRTWLDPVVDNLGHDPRSPYVERFWLAVLGPSCLLLLRRLAHGLEQSPDGFEFVSAQWAAEMGLAKKGGRNGPFWRALERGCRFRAMQRNGDVLAVRRRLPPLSSRQAARLPSHLGLEHQAWLEHQLSRSRRSTLAMWNPDRAIDGHRPPEGNDGHALNWAA